MCDYLGRISGARFELRESQSAPAGGIVVAAWADFASLPLDPGFKEGILHEDDYLLRSHAGGLWVIGHTPQAVSHAVWGLLYHIGHRQFFPGDAWEVVPHEPVLTLAVDVLEHPDYRNRGVAAGLTSGGPDAYGDRAHVIAWRKRNRASAGPLVHSGHAYGAIIRRNRAAFDAHPEYLALVDGQRRGGKFCISNPGLQALIVEDALAQFRQKPNLMSIAMDPSDGGGWCECEPCAKFGSVTDRVVALANLVAEAIPQGRYVGILAYNFHSPPPTIHIHPRVVVTVAAGHLTGGWTPERLFAPWAAQGGAPFMGVFEYYNNIISLSLPQGQRGSDLAYIQRTLPDFHSRGARMVYAGASYANGSIGLGAYMAARITWDVDQAQQMDALYADFLDRAFGPAREPMDRFYRLVHVLDDKSPRMPLTSDKVGRMYRALDEAMALTQDPAITRRIMDLVRYTRYVEIYLDFAVVPDAKKRVEAYGDLLRYAYRIRESMMVNAYGLFAFPQRVTLPEGTGWGVAEADNPWKDPTPVTDSDALAFLRAGIENNPIGTYEIRWFSEELVPAAQALGFAEKPAVSMGLPPMGRQVFYTWVDKAPATIDLLVQGGAITHYRGRMGPVRITLHSDQAVDDQMTFIVATDQSVLPDGQTYRVSLATPHTGLHWIEVDDGGGGTQVLPARADMGLTVDLGAGRTFNNRFLWNGYFYVPKGTKRLSFHVARTVANPPAQIRDSQGRTLLRFPRLGDAVTEENAHLHAGGYLHLDVPPGQDGQVWEIYRAQGQWRLLNVPPYLASQPSQLLLPKEVVEADRR